MQLYNSLTKSFETFGAQDREIRLYACGITPYDTTHLGHAFTYCSVDILIRYLEYSGGIVRYIQNVTDIDDDMLREAAEKDEDWKRLGDQWTEQFIEDMTALNVHPPDEMPRASSAIPDIVEAVKKLVETGHAYSESGSVYYDLESWPDYGKLSKLSRDEMLPIANERGNFPEDPNKRQPLDFVLWQAQAPGEPAWGSPWGPGRPGWHIECSILAGRLGATLDVHAGGGDLIFPHHESEIAQSEALNNAPLARTWMHIAMVEHDGEKMSKSLGNMVYIHTLLDGWSPNAIRLYLASHHYREAWSYSERDLEVAANWAEALRRAVQDRQGSGKELETHETENAFAAAMENDLNSPEAIKVLLELSQEIKSADEAGHAVGAAQDTLDELAGTLGLRLTPGPPSSSVVDGWRIHL
jgi:L-cysteine:1D-myo-inositol 2-amino-2-deoxy-alpha-D-glucopyranoside ligase